MSKKVLLIESDAGFAREMSNALERKGFETRTTGDGKEGLDLAREEQPDAIVLCVELPKMSGYSICAKLKKDEALKAIPVVIISAEATPETFDQHRQLKTRAEDYLIKPFESAQLVERLGSLIGLPPVPEAPEATETPVAQEAREPAPSPAASEEEVVTLADVELESLAEAEPEPANAMPVFGAALEASPESEDEDLKLLDNAFESIAAPAQDNSATGPTGRDFSFGSEGRSPPPAPVVEDELISPPPSADSSADEEAALLEAFGPTESVEPPASLSEPTDEPVRGANVEMLRAAGIPVMEPAPEPDFESASAMPEFSDTLPSLGEDSNLARALASKDEDLALSRREIAERDSELQHLREHVQDLEGRVVRGAADLARAETDLRSRDADLASTRSRLDSTSAMSKKLEADLRASREETQRIGDRASRAEKELAQTRERADRAEKELAATRERADQAEKDLAHARERAEEAERAVGQKAAEMSEVLGKLEAAEQELDGLRIEIAAAQNEANSAREDFDQRAEGLQKRIEELETSNSKNEERVVKAYQKIKGDEKLREKTRKALTIALQLLDEHVPAADPDKRTPARE